MTTAAAAEPLPAEDPPPSSLSSPLLEFLGEHPVLFKELVLARLDPTDLALFAKAGPEARAAVVASGLPRAGVPGGVLLEVKDFVSTVELLAWAKEKGCPWGTRTCALVARGGHLESVEVGASARLPVGCRDECIRRCGWASGSFEVGAGAPLPVG